MALSFLRPNLVARHVKRQLYPQKRNAGYVVLIPEIGEDRDKSMLLSENGLPEFNALSIEKCIGAITKQSLEYESGVQQIEQATVNGCKNAFVDIFQPLELLDSQLELTWGMAKTLYLGNSSLMPTKTYIQIHERAHNARTSKFNSEPIFHAAVDEKNKLKKLTDEEQRVLDKYILEGRLNGLDVKGIKKDRLHSILVELKAEKNIFRDKVNYATKAFTSTINNPETVRGMPPAVLKAMSVCNDPDKGPYKVSLQQHIYEPFMQYCPDREMRWNAWQAYVKRCSNHGGNTELENSGHISKIQSLRHEQAKILGFDTYADMSMETKMAGSVENVNKVLDSLLETARPFQDAELEVLQDYALERGFDRKLAIYDIPYWQRKQKWSLYNFDEHHIREYFSLPKVINSLFNLCSTLFRIQIVERTGVQAWHKDVKFYDVFDEEDERPVAGFYLDPYAREDEKIRIYGDAGWHIAIQNRNKTAATKPLSALIFNFLPPAEDRESLLSFEEVGTLFQKFGHALRHLLTKANYSEVAGLSNVEWDAAEVCGQFLTHWLYDPNTIRAISGHYSTNEPLPEEIVKNLHNIRMHMAGYNLCNELYLSKLDLEFHTTKGYWRDIIKELYPKYHSLPLDKYDAHPLSFTKIFSEEWGAAYYCHLWSRMLAADIYSAFEEARQSDQDITTVGKRYKDTFLACGGGCHPSEIFRRFRGRDPTHHALLINLGLTKLISE